MASVACCRELPQHLLTDECYPFLRPLPTTAPPTGMLHTRYHFKAHHEALPEALDRFAAMLSQPRLDPEDCLKELDNVHAEWSRNCNSDGRRLLQVKRSFGTAPYSSFSTGNVSSLRDEPTAAGLQPADGLRGLWQERYTGDHTHRQAVFWALCVLLSMLSRSLAMVTSWPW